MPDLSYRVIAVSAAARGLTPLLHFRLAITNDPADETIYAVILQAQIQIKSSQRSYSPQEKRKLAELFGPPDRWGQTLRNKLWAHSPVSVSEFAGSTETILPVPCTYDLNVAATKYFNAAFLIRPDGSDGGVYQKMHLVPFGEYVPLFLSDFHVIPDPHADYIWQRHRNPGRAGQVRAR